MLQKTFLLVEDNADDALLLRRSFIRSKLLNHLHVVDTAESAIAYLKGTGRYSDRTNFPFPSIVLLDLQLPGMSGFELVKWIRADPSFRALRIVILTSSDDMRDVRTAHELGANSFLMKPADLDCFVEFSQAIGGYWTWSDSPDDWAFAPQRKDRGAAPIPNS